MKYTTALVLVLCLASASAFRWPWGSKSSSSNDGSVGASIGGGAVATSSTFNPPNYRQCDSRWGSTTLGTGSKTICQSGCLMTSVTNILAAEGVQLNGQTITPASFNNWLKSHNGFASGNLLMWGAAASLGLRFDGFVHGGSAAA